MPDTEYSYSGRMIRAFGKGALIGLAWAGGIVVGALAIVGAVTLIGTSNSTEETDPEKFLESSIREIKAQLSEAEFELAELRKGS